MPFLRTFAPFVAGVARMTRPKFTLYDVTGGGLWVAGVVSAGYFFGGIPWVKAHLDKLAAREYQRRNDTKAFATVVVKDHPNARITAIDPGDDILVEANLDWYGRTRLWSRVLSVDTALDGDETAVLKVARADAYRY